ncbi:AMP-binding protein [Pseudoruegeria sp. HB172150]|uniref:AMP-binding protein n=1 Tax=Pseudoruegeria sp. HB172150 TaxID=2721164 RepID=UPI001557CFF9|nr:AMP-binding protein [Pseudoruegeria sp. HB172150]
MTTMHNVLRNGAELYGDRAAILFGEDILSYSAVLEMAERFAAGLGALGVGPGDSVACLMDNSMDAIRVWFGVALLGAADVPMNPQYRGDLLAYLLSDSGATVVICDAEYFPGVLELTDRLPELRLMVIRGEMPRDVPERPALVPMAEVDGSESAEVNGAEERVILYTSGTTGPSKGVVHTQASSLVLSEYNAACLEYGPKDRLLNFFPLFHQNARYTGVLPALVSGGSIRMQRKFSSSRFWDVVGEDGITAFNYLGSVLRLILNVTPEGWGRGDHTLTKAFGAGATPALWEECERRLAIRLVETYGLSEAPMATLNSGLAGCAGPVGSAGRASELFEVAVVDEADRQVPAGTIGEIVMRPRRPNALMQGYLNKDAATVRAFRNLWFHSGDRGRLNEEGFLYFEARDKDSIRRRGENISAWEVESVLDRHPDVAETAVFGIPCEETDEEVAAAVVWKCGKGDFAALLAHAEARLPEYAVPTWFRVMEDLPRTSTEKVQKAELRKAGRDACVAAAELKGAVAET